MKSSEGTKDSFLILAHLSKSIGHPTRLHILNSIANKGGWIEGEIVSIPNVSPSTVIQHLRELKRAGIIQGRIFGTQCKYGLNGQILKEFDEIWHQTMSHILEATKNT
jgi:predicted transcriptional regulator